MARDCVVAEERIVRADAAEGRAASLAVRGEPRRPEPCSGEPNGNRTPFPDTGSALSTSSKLLENQRLRLDQDRSHGQILVLSSRSRTR